MRSRSWPRDRGSLSYRSPATWNLDAIIGNGVGYLSRCADSRAALPLPAATERDLAPLLRHDLSRRQSDDSAGSLTNAKLDKCCAGNRKYQNPNVVVVRSRGSVVSRGQLGVMRRVDWSLAFRQGYPKTRRRGSHSVGCRPRLFPSSGSASWGGALAPYLISQCLSSDQ